jgi:actin-related protein 6
VWHKPIVPQKIQHALLLILGKGLYLQLVPQIIPFYLSHSFTHIVPFVQGQIVRDGVIRIDMGGKALTNQLKDWISYRQLNVMDETYVINCCKEDACFVSTDFRKDMENWRAKRVEYILPDFVQLMRGQVRQYGIKVWR